MNTLLSITIIIAFLCQFLSGLAFSWATPQQYEKLRRWSRWGQYGSLCSISFAVLIKAITTSANTSALTASIPGLSQLSFGLQVDALSLMFGLLVSSLSLLIFRFSERYMARDRSEKRFYIWAHFCVASVLAMTFAGDLLTFWFFWFLSSVCLHQLLNLYGDRPAAKFASRKKFFISRLGDLALLSAAYLLFDLFGTLNFSDLAALASTNQWQSNTALTSVAALIVLGAMTKSAQVPFQSWLPETLEAPTPVSAFMHAGIINGGGYLVLRTYDLVHVTQWAASAMCLLGILTVAIAGLSMLTIPDIKRQLAYSTSAQMGFMFVQLGLGVPGAALLHMVGHAFFKAHAFLNAGYLKSPKKPSQQSLGRELAMTAAISGMSLAPLLIHLFWLPEFLTFNTAIALGILVLALTEGARVLLTLSGEAHLRRQFFLASTFVMLVGVTAALYLGSYAANLLNLPQQGANTFAASHSIALISILIFQAVIWMQNLLPLLPLNRHTAVIYSILRNGFYFEAFTRRLLRHPH